MKPFEYIYGVVGQPLSASILGIEDQPVRLIPFHDLFLVTSPVSAKNFSQKKIDINIKKFKWLEQYAPQHEAVVNAVLAQTTIVPFRFCTIFKNEAIMKKTLSSQYAKLTQNLSFLSGKIEISVKLSADHSQLAQRATDTNPDLQQLSKTRESESEGKAYFTQQKIAQLTRRTQSHLIEDAVNKVFAELSPQAILTHSKPLLKTKKGELIPCMNGVFLIEKSQQIQFQSIARDLFENDSAFKIQVSEGLAPYDFVT